MATSTTTPPTAGSTAAAGWGSLSAEMRVKIWRLLPSPTLWSCRLVCQSWDREISVDYARQLPNFDPTTCDMTRMQDYHGFAAPEMGPGGQPGDFAAVYHTRRMLKKVQHLKLCCAQDMSTGNWGTVTNRDDANRKQIPATAPQWLYHFLVTCRLAEARITELTLQCDCAYDGGQPTADLIGTSWPTVSSRFPRHCLLAYPDAWIAPEYLGATVEHLNVAMRVCPNTLDFTMYPPRPQVSICDPALSSRQLTCLLSRLPSLTTFSLRESPQLYQYNRALGLLSNALLPMVLHGVSLRQLFKLKTLRLACHGGGNGIWTPMLDLCQLLHCYPLYNVVAPHDSCAAPEEVSSPRSLTLELMLPASPAPRDWSTNDDDDDDDNEVVWPQTDWDEAATQTAVIYSMMRAGVTPGPLPSRVFIDPCKTEQLLPIADADMMEILGPRIPGKIGHLERLRYMETQFPQAFSRLNVVVFAHLGITVQLANDEGHADIAMAHYAHHHAWNVPHHHHHHHDWPPGDAPPHHRQIYYDLASCLNTIVGLPAQMLALDPPPAFLSPAHDDDEDAALANYRAAVVELFNSETGQLGSGNLSRRLIRPLMASPPHAVEAAVHAAVGGPAGPAPGQQPGHRPRPPSPPTREATSIVFPGLVEYALLKMLYDCAIAGERYRIYMQNKHGYNLFTDFEGHEELYRRDCPTCWEGARLVEPEDEGSRPPLLPPDSHRRLNAIQHKIAQDSHSPLQIRIYETGESASSPPSYLCACRP